MKKFVLKLLLFLAPVILLVSIYIILDPFKIIFSYDSFYENGKPSLIGLNRDYVSVETFKKNYPVYNYDSYILGNSRSRFYKAAEWQPYIGSDKIFHFDAGGESLYGLAKKIQFLEDRDIKIKNALLVIDYELLIRIENHASHLFSKHRELSGDNFFNFHKEFLKVFFSKTFLKAFLDLKVSGQVKPYMLTNWVFDDIPITYNLKNNELTLSFLEDSILHHPENYYKNKEHVFYKRVNNTDYDEVVGKRQLEMLTVISQIFKKHKTNYRIAISPLYNQRKLHKNDLQLLVKIFGKDKVFDFSGKNKLTEPVKNYYENSHYRETVSKAIIDSVYGFRRLP